VADGRAARHLPIIRHSGFRVRFAHSLNARRRCRDIGAPIGGDVVHVAPGLLERYAGFNRPSAEIPGDFRDAKWNHPRATRRKVNRFVLVAEVGAFAGRTPIISREEPIYQDLLTKDVSAIRRSVLFHKSSVINATFLLVGKIIGIGESAANLVPDPPMPRKLAGDAGAGDSFRRSYPPWLRKD